MTVERLASNVRSSILLLSPFFLWGTAMVAMKGVIADTTPLFLAGMRLLPAGLLVLVAAFLMKRPQPRTWKGWAWILAFAAIDGALFQGFLALGLTRTGAGLGSVMIDSQPLAVALMARWLFREYVGSIGWLGLTVGILGISLLGLPDEWIFSLLQGHPDWLSDNSSIELLLQKGEWLMLLAALSMAAGTILIRYVCRHADPVSATGWHMVFGGIPLFFLSWKTEVSQVQGLNYQDWLAVAYATVMGSAVAYAIFFYLASKSNLTSLSALTFLTPVFALVFSSIFLQEELSFLQWSGVSLTLLSIYLINQREELKIKLKKILVIEDEPESTPLKSD